MKRLILALLLLPFPTLAAEVCFTIPNARLASFVDELAEAGGCVPQAGGCQLAPITMDANGVPQVPSATPVPKADFAKIIAKRLLVEFYAKRKGEKAANQASQNAAKFATDELQ